MSLISQGFRYQPILKTFTRLFPRYKDLVCKVGCTKKLISNGKAIHKFYSDVVNRARELRENPV